jgi:hypothetical protein
VPGDPLTDHRSVQESGDTSTRKLTRRGLMGATFGVALVGVSRQIRGGLGNLASFSRPGPVGRSAGRCGQCGSPDHTMLAAGCPAAPEVI